MNFRIPQLCPHITFGTFKACARIVMLLKVLGNTSLTHSLACMHTHTYACACTKKKEEVRAESLIRKENFLIYELEKGF